MNNEEKILEVLEQMQSDMAGMQADMTGMKADMAEMKVRLEQVDERSQRTALIVDTEIRPQLKLLYEGHGAIMEKLDELCPKSRVEVLEDDMAMLKDVVKLMRREISELRQAQ